MAGTPAMATDPGSVACLGACPERPTLLFLPGADGDKLGEVRGRLLRGAFPEPNSGSPASWGDPPPRPLLCPASPGLTDFPRLSQ